MRSGVWPSQLICIWKDSILKVIVWLVQIPDFVLNLFVFNFQESIQMSTDIGCSMSSVRFLWADSDVSYCTVYYSPYKEEFLWNYSSTLKLWWQECYFITASCNILKEMLIYLYYISSFAIALFHVRTTVNIMIIPVLIWECPFLKLKSEFCCNSEHVFTCL